MLAALAAGDKVRVLFVCLGNICRSPAAEGVLSELVREAGTAGRWVIDSAGTGRWHIGQLPDKRMRVHARRRGIELTHHCRQVSVSDFDDFDLIVPMDSQNESDLRQLAPSPEAEARIVPMAAFVDKAMRYDYIPDPYYEGAEGFELVLDLLDSGCRCLREAAGG
ncbi:MAG: low molecular weight phosphotyrosine protein phosphatase [Muribaculaceae bacterium]|nr:low molecular weight phosphotyrosine protein phosphatase [Muribaculaceae bacterium]MDE6197398.1 low molecular weight phosphotyrosine protein phosphatase [Muribaculaceae bacterium]